MRGKGAQPLSSGSVYGHNSGRRDTQAETPHNPSRPKLHTCARTNKPTQIPTQTHSYTYTHAHHSAHIHTVETNHAEEIGPFRPRKRKRYRPSYPIIVGCGGAAGQHICVVLKHARLTAEPPVPVAPIRARHAQEAHAENCKVWA